MMETSLEPIPTVSAPLSAYQARFLAFVKQHPEALDRATFSDLPSASSESPARYLHSDAKPIQPWPLLLDPAQDAELARMSVRVLDLIRDVPQRFFQNDPQQITEFYGLDPAEMSDLRKIIELPTRAGGEIMRGDFVWTATGVWCIEANMNATLGGKFTAQVARAYLREPLLRRYFSEQKVVVTYQDPWRSFLLLAIRRALARSLNREGELNIAIVMPGAPCYYERTIPDINADYRDLLSMLAPGVSGRVLICNFQHLAREKSQLKADGVPVRVVVHYAFNTSLTDSSLPDVGAWLDGLIELYPNPLVFVYSDKRNLALLSEGATHGNFDSEDAAFIQRHIPWTRCLKSERFDFHGACFAAAELLEEKREHLVLKPAQGYGGACVHIGRFTPPNDWRDVAQTALADRNYYVVQEYVEPRLHQQQHGEHGSADFVSNCGLFVYGDRFGGSYLRMGLPNTCGIMNTEYGAEANCFLTLWGEGQTVASHDEATLIWSFRK